MKRRDFFGSVGLLGAAFGMPWPSSAKSITTAPQGRAVVLQTVAIAGLPYTCTFDLVTATTGDGRIMARREQLIENTVPFALGNSFGIMCQIEPELKVQRA